MIDDPGKRLAQLRAIEAEKKLLRAKRSADRAAAQAAHQAALAELERLKVADGG